MKSFWGKYKGKPIFKNMFIAVFSLAAACTLLACVMFLIWFKISEVEDEKQNDISMLYASSLMIDNYIHSIQDTMEVLQNDNYVRKIFVKEESLWDGNMMIAAQEVLNTVTVDTMYHSIYVIKDGDYVLKCSNSCYPMNMKADEMMVEAFYQSTFGEYATHYYIDVYQKNQSLLFMTNGEQNPATGEKENGIMISVDIGSIMENVLPGIREREEYLLVNRKGDIVYTKGDRYKSGDTLENEEIIQILEQAKERSAKKIKVEGENYLLTYVGIEDDFCLIHLLPFEYITAPIHQIRNVFICISILFGILILLLAFGMSNWVYYPIDAVVNTTKSKSEKMSDDVEERLKNTELSSIYQTFHSMVQTLNNLTMKAEQQELAGYLRNKNQTGNVPEWVVENYGKDGILSCVICLRISDTQDLHINNTQEAIEFEFQTIVNIIGQLMKPLGNVLVNPVDREHIAVILFTENSVDLKKLTATIKEIFKVTQDLTHISMDAGISNEREGCEEIASMYQMARAATVYRFLYGIHAIITENDMVNKALGEKAEIDVENFVQCLKNNDCESFWHAYDDIILQLKNYSIQTARDMLLNMAAEMLKFKNSLNYNHAPLGSMDYEVLSAELNAYEYITDARAWFEHMADDIWSILARVRQSGREDVVDKAVVYLNENYADTNISAQYIADMFHITPSYFSRLFNERTGCAFPDYLATLRTEKAKEMLLEEENRSIQEICEAVGYVNSSYFTATFKKKYGITPGQFRKNHRKSEEF